MYGIEVLVKEHENIQRFNCVVRKMCIRMMDGEEPDLDDFEKAILFVRNYADKHHHGKEEEILFDAMEKYLGETAAKLIRNGMLVEHDLGRLYIRELEEAVHAYRECAGCEEYKKKETKLNILMNASGYTSLLNRHIEKENNVAYTFAERSLDKSVWKEINEQTKRFEETQEKKRVSETYLTLLRELEEKYQS